MSVNEVNPPRNNYVGNGATTVFAYTFRILTSADIEVQDAGVVKTLTTDYTVSGVGDASGGSVTFLVAPLNLNNVALLRKEKIDQQTAYVEANAFPEASHENAVDKLTMIAQQFVEIFGRCLQVPKKSLKTDLTVPDPSSLALLQWNTALTGLQNVAIADLTAISLVIPDPMTAGSVIFASGAKVMAQDNANLFYDNVNNRLGLLTAAPEVTLHLGANPLVATANFTGAKTNTRIESIAGTAVSPHGTQDPVAIFQKVSNSTGTTGVNQTVYISIDKTTDLANHRATGLFVEAVDSGGDAGGSPISYVEGIRSHGVLLAADGNALGGLFMAGTAAAIAYDFLVGIEGEVRNQSGAEVGATFNKNKFAASFLASSLGTETADAGFVTNPFNTAGSLFREGFLVAEDSVTEAAFRSRAATVFGLDLQQGSQSTAAILIDNNTPFMVRNNADAANLDVLKVSAADALTLGTGTANTIIQPTSGNLGLGVTAFGTSADGVIGINADGTIPSTSPAGMIQIFADDSSDGAANATLALRTEQAVETIGTFTASHKLKIWINGVEYWFQLDAV